VLKFVLLTVPKDDRPVFPKRGAYPQNVWCRTGTSGPGTFSGGMGVVTQAEKTALLWLYNRVSRKLDEEAGGPCETSCEYPNRSIAAFVNWPIGMKEANPVHSVPPYAWDREFGFFAFRGMWRDGNDIVISCQPKATRGWHRADKEVGDVWVWGLGRQEKWGTLRGDVTHFAGAADGSGTATVGGTAFGVDFSGASGATAMLVMCGPGAGGGAEVQAGGSAFAFKFLGGQGAPPVAEGDRVTVGGQSVTLSGGNIAFGRWAGDWRVNEEAVRAAGTPGLARRDPSLDRREVEGRASRDPRAPGGGLSGGAPAAKDAARTPSRQVHQGGPSILGILVLWWLPLTPGARSRRSTSRACTRGQG
jgi:hypothetical protein